MGKASYTIRSLPVNTFPLLWDPCSETEYIPSGSPAEKEEDVEVEF